MFSFFDSLKVWTYVVGYSLDVSPPPLNRMVYARSARVARGVEADGNYFVVFFDVTLDTGLGNGFEVAVEYPHYIH